MEHPFISNLKDKSVDELQKTISELTGKLSFAYRILNQPLIHQLRMAIESYKVEYNRQMDEMIKKQATTNTASNFFISLTSEKDFPLTLNQLNELIKSPADFAGSALEQSADVAERIRNITKGEVSKVDLAELI